MPKLTSVIVALGVVVGGWWGISTPPPQNVAIQHVRQSEVAVIPTPTPGKPVRIVIPQIDVNAEVEQVGKDSKERMDVPKIVNNVGWYNLGKRPGEAGSAVMAGHLNDSSLNPGVFYKLEQLKQDDWVLVYDEIGREYRYKVVKIEKYPEQGFPITTVFGSSDIKRLNLITCEGEWDSRIGSYNLRTVVFTELTNN